MRYALQTFGIPYSFYTLYNILRFRIKIAGEFVSSTTVYTLII